MGVAVNEVASAAAYCHFQSTDQDADDTVCTLTLDVRRAGCLPGCSVDVIVVVLLFAFCVCDRGSCC